MAQVALKALRHPFTKPAKEELKRLGGQWNGQQEVWMIPVERYAEAVQACDAAGARGPQPQTTSQAHAPAQAPTVPKPAQPAAPIETPAAKPTGTPPASQAPIVSPTQPSPQRVAARQAAVQAAAVLKGSEKTPGAGKDFFELAEDIENWILRP